MSTNGTLDMLAVAIQRRNAAGEALTAFSVEVSELASALLHGGAAHAEVAGQLASLRPIFLTQTAAAPMPLHAREASVLQALEEALRVLRDSGALTQHRVQEALQASPERLTALAEGIAERAEYLMRLVAAARETLPPGRQGGRAALGEGDPGEPPPHPEAPAYLAQAAPRYGLLHEDPPRMPDPEQGKEPPPGERGPGGARNHPIPGSRTAPPGPADAMAGRRPAPVQR